MITSSASGRLPSRPTAASRRTSDGSRPLTENVTVTSSCVVSIGLLFPFPERRETDGQRIGDPLRAHDVNGAAVFSRDDGQVADARFLREVPDAEAGGETLRFHAVEFVTHFASTAC